MTKPRHGPLMAGEPVQLTDPKGRSHVITLRAGASFHTHRGTLSHDDIIGGPDGNVVRSGGGTPYVVFRPLLADYTLTMKRGAAVVYPKDAAQIVAFADVFPGARVLEAGAGSGALACWLLRADRGSGHPGLVRAPARLRRDRPAQRRAVLRRAAAGLAAGDRRVRPPRRRSRAGRANCFDRVILDMLAPWDCVDAAAGVLAPGGLACCYVATTTQLSRTVEALRGHGGFDEPAAWESLVRGWHVEGLAVRPEHRMVGHTGFLVTARRLAPGVVPPPRRRRPRRGPRGSGGKGSPQERGGPGGSSPRGSN